MSSEFTREAAIEVLDRATSDGKSWRDCVVDAVLAAHRLGAESAAVNLHSLKSRSAAWGDIHDALNALAPKWADGNESTPVANAVREIQRVYAECRTLRDKVQQLEDALIAESRRSGSIDINSFGAKPAPELKLTDVTKELMTRSGEKGWHYIGETTGHARVFEAPDGDLYRKFHDGRTYDDRPSDSDIVNVPAEPRKVKVEVRLHMSTLGPWVEASVMGEHERIWSAHPHIASTTIEMELPEE